MGELIREVPDGAVQTVVISGATSGIGFATAQALACQGFRIIAMGRDRNRVAQKDAEIRAVAPKAKVEWIVADLSRLAEVRRAAADIGRLAERVDILINNAGLFLDRRFVTADGFETTFAVNYLAPFLLTACLLVPLRRGRAHIINVSSIGHTMVDGMRWDDLQMEEGFTPIAAYAQSKLGNVLFTRELARRFTCHGLLASAVHPGLVASRFPLTGGAETIAHYRAAEASGAALSEEQGAETIVWLACAREAALPSGGYFYQRKRIDPAIAGQDENAAVRLWEISEKLVA
jgi:NAD(P)-dependent dehydrogenase (short-subunit alcohol dehydrogenase family)